MAGYGFFHAKLPQVSCQFQYGSSTIHASGTPAHIDLFQHVLRVEIQRSPFDRWMHWIVRRLPSPIRDVMASLPSRKHWLLPPKIVVKKLKPDWEEEFEHEKRMYEVMKSLQGHVIPEYYGEVECDGTRALVFSDVGGFPLNDYSSECPEWPVEDVKKMAETSFASMAAFGLVQGDDKMDNFHVVDDRLVVLDLERVEHFTDPDKLAYVIRSGVKHVLKNYDGKLKTLKYDRGHEEKPALVT